MSSRDCSGSTEMQTEPVPPPVERAATSIVTWKVKVLETGIFPLKVVSSTGLSQAKTISIARPEGTPELRLTVDLTGSFEPGQEFVSGPSWHPPAKYSASTPVLTLPAGLTVARVLWYRCSRCR